MNPQVALTLSALSFAMAGAVLALSTYIALWTGLLSFATVAFAALGAFVATYILNNTDLSIWLAMPVAIVIGGIAGLVVGKVFLKLASHWLALATVALVLITRVLVVNFPEYTGGSGGIVFPIKLSLLELLIIVSACCLILSRLAHSKFGIAATTTREDPEVAAALGVPVERIRVIAFGISGALGALGGVMLSSQLGFIDADTFFIALSVTVIASVVLGGAYHWAGSVIGAAVFTGLPVYISQFISHGQFIIYGLLLLAIIIFLPGGLIDPVRWRRRSARRKVSGSAKPMAETPKTSIGVEG
jgi:branched-chain amino acid transport system permease protein